ncbi:MAG: hypothetical protein DRP85_06430 [Candidatus Makaraimicrobium thalassicum]|nr:MAG: hypothetical protein DRP85_06430 [Candidatus Omnitrophota bacterium]
MKDDFPHYAEKCLKIRGKEAREVAGTKTKIFPFNLNRAQKYAHERLEEQLLETGRVRALILKGRQQGMSTYIGGRYYWKTTKSEGLKTFILTHRDDATDNLFKMVQRYHEHNNPLVKPHTKYSNRRELVFDLLDSAYSLGTAGSGEVGRSDTIDLLHGSEVAVWKNTVDIRAGLMQAAEGAQEIIFESTAKGMGNMFHEMWQDAEAGLSDYIAIFIPYFWQAEYQRDAPLGFDMSAEEKEYLELHKGTGCKLEHVVWRRAKIKELGGVELFKQEYPATAAEAFQMTGVDSFIKPNIVLKARKNIDILPGGAHIVGLDPARGGDRTSFIHRQGRVAWGLENILTPDTNLIVGKVKLLMELKKNPVDRLFIDIGGLGGPIYDQLRTMPFGDRVTPINFGDRDVYNPERYYNKRVEMWGDMRDWLADTALPVIIPDDDSLQTDICGPGYKWNHVQQYLLESKEDMKKRGVRSPDGGDALGLTFAQPVMPAFSEGGQDSGFVPFAV